MGICLLRDSKDKKFDNELARASKRRSLIKFVAECQLMGIKLKSEKPNCTFITIMEQLLLVSRAGGGDNSQ
jgi:hypothetical protein